jgi:SsrA-binding protein
MTDFATNPRATFDFEIIETIDAGLVLKGHEVKSIKKGQASIKGAYVKILNGQAFLIGANIPPYQPANTPETYDPQSTHQLLLTKKQIDNLVGLAKSHGLTLVPIKLFSKKSLVKLSIGIARGKKKYDKRETIKKKDIQRAKDRGIQD